MCLNKYKAITVRATKMVIQNNITKAVKYDQYVIDGCRWRVRSFLILYVRTTIGFGGYKLYITNKINDIIN